MCICFRKAGFSHDPAQIVQLQKVARGLKCSDKEL